MTSSAFLRSALDRIADFAADQHGTTAVEYGLMVALISIAIVSTVFSMGQGIRDTLYGGIVRALSSMM